MRRVLVEVGCPWVEAAVCRPWGGRPLVALAVGRLLAGVEAGRAPKSEGRQRAGGWAPVGAAAVS